MEITLSKDSIVDRRTGEIETPAEYLDTMREIEACIASADDEITTLKMNLKHARDNREKLIARLRAGVRDGSVLPLLELAERPEESDVAGLDVED